MFQPFSHVTKNSGAKINGAYWELNPGPLTYSSKEPKARIIPLDHTPNLYKPKVCIYHILDVDITSYDKVF